MFLTFYLFLYEIIHCYRHIELARGSVVVKALSYKPEGHGFEA
jgi:hypothetical protein